MGQDQAHRSNNMAVAPNQKDQVLAPGTIVMKQPAGSLPATHYLTRNLEMVCMTLKLDQKPLGFAKHFLPCLLRLLKKNSKL